MKRLLLFTVGCLLYLTAGAQIDFVNDGVTKWICVEVVDGEDVLISSHIEESKALACAASNQYKYPDRDFRAVSTQRKRAIIDIAAQAQSVVIAPNLTDVSPPSGTDCPTGWQCTEIGDGTCDVTEISSTKFSITAAGTSDEGDGCYVHKTAASTTDIEVKALIPSVASWGGTITPENFTGAGVMLREGTDKADYQTHVFWPFQSQTRFKIDAGGVGETEYLGGEGQITPQYIYIQYDESVSLFYAWESINGSAWYNVGPPVSKTLTFPVEYGVFATSHNPAFTVTIDLDEIAASTTLASITDTGDITQPSGTDFPVAEGTPLFNCNTEGVAPGDTVTLQGTSRGPIEFVSCFGTSASNITIRNDTTESGPLVITGSGSGVQLNCDDCVHVTLTGLGKWSGAPAGTCGVTIAAGVRTEGRTQCGIVIEDDGTPNGFIRFSGTSSDYTVQGIEVDGTGSTLGIGISANDQTETTIAFRENIKFTQNYVHDTFTEGMYLGQNWFRITDNGNPQIRGIEVSYNLVERTGRQAINIKAAPTGTNLVFGNNAYDAANEKPTGLIDMNTSRADVYGNYLNGNAGGRDCVSWSAGTDIDDPLVGDMTIAGYNNVLVNCARDGFRVGDNGSADYIPNLGNNTIVTTGGRCINTTSSVDGGGAVRDNICAATGGLGVGSGTITEENNIVGTILEQDFAGAGMDDYRLTVDSQAVDAGTANAPADDHNLVSRPIGGIDDQGAYEYQP